MNAQHQQCWQMSPRVKKSLGWVSCRRYLFWPGLSRVLPNIAQSIAQHCLVFTGIVTSISQCNAKHCPVLPRVLPNSVQYSPVLWPALFSSVAQYYWVPILSTWCKLLLLGILPPAAAGQFQWLNQHQHPVKALGFMVGQKVGERKGRRRSGERWDFSPVWRIGLAGSWYPHHGTTHLCMCTLHNQTTKIKTKINKQPNQNNQISTESLIKIDTRTRAQPTRQRLSAMHICMCSNLKQPTYLTSRYH